MRTRRSLGLGSIAMRADAWSQATSNVGVDRHAPALRRRTYAPAHGLRRNAGACPRRTTC